MFKDILKGYNDEAFVYIIGSASGMYVSYSPSHEQVSGVRGVNDWDICSGYVKDLKKINGVDDLLEMELPPKKEETKPGKSI